jgi:hypothetical protein
MTLLALASERGSKMLGHFPSEILRAHDSYSFYGGMSSRWRIVLGDGQSVPESKSEARHANSVKWARNLGIE